MVLKDERDRARQRQVEQKARDLAEAAERATDPGLRQRLKDKAQRLQDQQESAQKAGPEQ